MTTSPAPDERKCPFCSELIKAEAKICRFCKSEIATPDAVAQLAPTAAAPDPLPRALVAPALPSYSEDTHDDDHPNVPEHPQNEKLTIAAFVASFISMFPTLLSLRAGYKYLDGGSGRGACIAFGVLAIAMCVGTIVFSTHGARTRMRSLARAGLLLAAIQLIAVFVIVIWVFFKG